MRLKTLGFARLDEIVERDGKDGVVAEIASRIAEGEHPSAIAKSKGLPYIVVKAFLEENGVDVVGLAKRAHADVLVSDALDAVKNAQPEDVSVARLKADTYLKVAGKQSAEWGDKGTVGVGGFGGITIVIGDVVPLVEVGRVGIGQVEKEVDGARIED